MFTKTVLLVQMFFFFSFISEQHLYSQYYSKTFPVRTLEQIKRAHSMLGRSKK